MRILVLGAGNVGTLIAYDLSEDYEIWVGDVNGEKLKRMSDFAKTLKINASNFEKLREVIKNFDFIVDALPGKFGYSTIKAAVMEGKDIVDVSFMPENPMSLNGIAKEKKVSVVVDAGFAPGLSNILVGHAYSELGELDEVIIDVGGLPKVPEPPLYYKLVFSPYDLIEEYTRPARIIEDGRIKEVDPMNRVENVKIGNFVFESFISDGLRTLLYTIRAKKMIERTLRWRGHIEKMRILKELGFFNKENVEFTMKVISSFMNFESEDFSIMRVMCAKDDATIKYFMYDEAQHGFSSMARSTGYITAILTRIAIEENLSEGIIPPEKLGMERNYFNYVVNEIRRRGITLQEEK